MSESEANVLLDRLKTLAQEIGDAGAGGFAGAPRFGGRCLPEEIDELCALFKVQLPSDYREWLLSCRRLFAPDVRSGYFLFSPISILDTWTQSGTPKRILGDDPEVVGDVPTIPIGGDAHGNLFLLSVSEDLNGSVWKWDQGVPPQTDGSLTHGTTRVAASFSAFLERVVEDWTHHLDEDSEWHYV